MGTTNPILMAAALATLLTVGACADQPDQTPLTPGIATVGFLSVPVAVPELTLSVATMHLGHITVLGNAAPPPGGPAPLHGPRPSDGAATELEFDALSSGNSVIFSTLPQGLYSRVEFFASKIAVAGSWRGRPMRALVVLVMHKRIDLRAATPRELGPDQNVTFTVAANPNTWFADNLLDPVLNGAPPSADLVITDQENPDVATELVSRIARSFQLR
jgi:hypothetical protein